MRRGRVDDQPGCRIIIKQNASQQAPESTPSSTVAATDNVQRQHEVLLAQARALEELSRLIAQKPVPACSDDPTHTYTNFRHHSHNKNKPADDVLPQTSNKRPVCRGCCCHTNSDSSTSQQRREYSNCSSGWDSHKRHHMTNRPLGIRPSIFEKVLLLLSDEDVTMRS